PHAARRRARPWLTGDRELRRRRDRARRLGRVPDRQRGPGPVPGEGSGPEPRLRGGRRGVAGALEPRYPQERMEPSRDAVLAALAKVIDPELQQPVTELNMVRDVVVEDGVVSLTIVLTVAGCPLRDSFERQVEEAFADVPGMRGFSLSFAVMTPEERQALTAKLRGGTGGRDKTIRLSRDTRVLAVASGKGGVGKSSLTANLAVAFSQPGRSTGVLDADIYGHSIPHILGIHQKPVAVDDLIVPPVKHDLKLMSIGFFLDE